MRYLVSGASGMIGSALVAHLTAHGHDVVSLSRAPSSPDFRRIHWNPESDIAPDLPDAPFDAVVHLAGESIASGRWNERKKAKIRESRVNGARLLCAAISRLRPPPRTLLGASAVGYYGSRGDEFLDEESGAGLGFLASVCLDLEAEIAFAREYGVRAVSLRFGMVLNERGGALARMLPPFRLGLGGRLGDGRQYMSWITLEDAVRAIEHCLDTESLAGPVIAASPHPVTNREFAKTLGRVLGRPAIFPVPGVFLRLALGEMAGELLLASQRVNPVCLPSTGFVFRSLRLPDALQAILGGVV